MTHIFGRFSFHRPKNHPIRTDFRGEREESIYGKKAWREQCIQTQRLILNLTISSANELI